MSGAPTPPPYTPALTARPASEPLHGAGPGTAYRRFWARAADFRGRASRSEFWWAFLINGLIATVGGFLVGTVIALAIAAIVGASVGYGNLNPSTAGQVAGRFWFFLMVLWGLVLYVPNAAVLVRRLHDAGLPGLLALLWFIPFLGFVIVLVTAALPTRAAAPPPPDPFTGGAPS